MTVLVTLGALAVSLAALSWLATTDAKRRRVFSLEPVERDLWQVWCALILVSVPGVLLLVAGNGAAFTVWIAAVTVLGWVLAAVTPDRIATVRSIIGRGATAALRVLNAATGWIIAVGTLPGRIADLEHRVVDLEAELARDRAKSDG